MLNFSARTLSSTPPEDRPGTSEHLAACQSSDLLLFLKISAAVSNLWFHANLSLSFPYCSNDKDPAHICCTRGSNPLYKWRRPLYSLQSRVYRPETSGLTSSSCINYSTASRTLFPKWSLGYDCIKTLAHSNLKASQCTGHVIKFTLPTSEPASISISSRCVKEQYPYSFVRLRHCRFQSLCLEQAPGGKSDLGESLCNYRELNGGIHPKSTRPASDTFHLS